MRVTHHKIDAPFHKGTNCNDRMKRCRQLTHLALIDLEIMTFTNHDNALFEDRRPEITNTKNLLRSGITKNVTAIGTTMTIIQGFLGFLESKKSAEYGIHSDMIERISDYTIGCD